MRPVNNRNGNLRRNKRDSWRKLFTYLKNRAWRKGQDTVNLRNIDLREAEITDIDLQYANMDGAILWKTTIKNSRMARVSLQNATIRQSNFEFVGFECADLNTKLIFNSNFVGCHLKGSELSGVILETQFGSNLSGVKTKSSIEWLRENFAVDPETGLFIVYKAIGDTSFNSPNDWVIEPGSIIRETVCFDRTFDCGSGVNFGTLKYIEEQYGESAVDIWECRLTGVPVVPFNSDGKARSDELKLIKIVDKYFAVEEDFDDDDDDWDDFGLDEYEYEEDDDEDEDEDDLYPDVYAQNADLYEEDEE